MLIRKPVENEQTFVGKRIVHTLDLSSIYPEKSPVMAFNTTVVRTSSSPNFRQPYNFVFEQNKIYFLTNVDRPATLRLNVYLNSTIKPTEGLRKYSRVFDVRDQTRKTHLFQLRSYSSLEEILKAEKAILDNFDSKLWKSGKPCKDCLSIAYIQPIANEYEIGVASTQRHSDLLEEFCFLGSIPDEHLKIASLQVNRKVAECKPIGATPKQPVEEYVVNAFLSVGTKSAVHSRMIVPYGIEKPIIDFFKNIG